MRKIKVKLIFEGRSEGRGVGFYGESLREALGSFEDVELVESDPDIVHYTYFQLFGPSLPLLPREKVVVTIHDLTPLRLPELYPVGIKGEIWRIYQQWRAKGVSAIVTDSKNSSDDIRELLGVDHHKIFVAPLAGRKHFYNEVGPPILKKIGEKYKLPKKFILTVAGGPNPNKNLVRLANVCKKIGLPLVIVGKGVGMDPKTVRPHAELRDYFELVKMSNVIRLGFVDDEDLLGLYKLATVYCQASLYEGFGLPLLEAMAAKALVVSSNSSSLPEIYDPSTMTFDPENEDEMCEVIKASVSLDKDQRGRIIKKNFEKSRKFSFEKMAADTIAAYKYSMIG